MASSDKPAAKILVELPGIEPGAISCRGCDLLQLSDLAESGERAFICVKQEPKPRPFGRGVFACRQLIWEPDLPRLAECLAAEKAATVAEAAVKVAEAMDEAFPTALASTPISAIASLLRHYPAVLVMEKGEIAGIITKADLLKTI